MREANDVMAAGAQQLRRLHGQLVKELKLLGREARGPTKRRLGKAATVAVLESAKLRQAELTQIGHGPRLLRLGKFLLSLRVDL